MKFKDSILGTMLNNQPTYKLEAVRQIAGSDFHDYDDTTPNQITVNGKTLF